MAGGRVSPLGRDDWARAAFEMFTESGLDAVAVERVAARLGATKGSFYWHFRNRAELLTAVLDLWLAETDEIIDAVAGIDDPRERLRTLFANVLRSVPQDRSEIDLFHRAEDPIIAAALERVSARRIGCVADAFREAGLLTQDAHDRAVQTYAMWLGLVQLHASLPALVPASADAARSFSDSMIALLDDMLPHSG